MIVLVMNCPECGMPHLDDVASVTKVCEYCHHEFEALDSDVPTLGVAFSDEVLEALAWS